MKAQKQSVWASLYFHRTLFCFFLFFFCSKLYKYQCKLLINMRVHVMPPSGLVLLDSMMSTQSWPEQGWALLQLLLVVSVSQAEKPVCRLTGDPENPQIFKDGDIMLGGIFSFHSSWKGRQDTYMDKPLPLQCTR